MKEKAPKKITFSVVLSEDDYEKLKELAAKESRPLAQMARVILEREVRSK